MVKRIFPLIFIFAVLLVSGCQAQDTVAGEKPDAAEKTETIEKSAAKSEPAKVEIREYEGKQLDAAKSFRENSIKGPQEIDIEKYRLTVDGLVEEPRELTFDEAANGFERFEKLITLYCVEGWDRTILWEGVKVKDLIGETLPEAKIVIFHAQDGYTTSLPLEYVIDNDIILADRMNKISLPTERGYPFQLVAEEKWGYKWIKWVTRIEVSDDETYRGYWENYGYSNDGSLDKSYYEKKR